MFGKAILCGIPVPFGKITGKFESLTILMIWGK